jgi:two-component system response regulator
VNLPKKDRREVLAELKTDDQLKTIPMVVLTTSQAEEGILKPYGLHAICQANPALLQQERVNLLSTALKFAASAP